MAPYGERIEGELTGFTYRTDDGGFAVARVRTEDGEAIAVGPLGHVGEGQHVSLSGRWSTHSQYGRRFKVESVMVDDPRTLRGLERYLGSGAVKGLGKEFARHQDYSEATAVGIDDEIRRFVNDAYSSARSIIEEHRGALEAITAALLEHEVLDGEEICLLIAQHSDHELKDLRKEGQSAPQLEEHTPTEVAEPA